MPDTPQHAIRDPEVGIVYVTGTKALYKHFVDANVIKVFKAVVPVSEAGMMAGYANIRQRVGVEVVIPPLGATGAADVVLHYVNGTWLLKTPPLAGMYWFHIAANPFNADEWLLLGNTINNPEDFTSAGGTIRMHGAVYDPLWHTFDAGLTWTAVPLTDPNGVTVGGIQRLTMPHFREDFGGQWFLAGEQNYFDAHHAVVWRGTGVSATATQYINTSYQDIRPSTNGFDGEIVTGNLSGSQFAIIPPTGNAYITYPLTNPLGIVGRLDRWPQRERGLVGVDDTGDLCFTSDYSGGTFPVVLSGAGGSCAAFADGTVVIGNLSGVGLVTNIASSPSLTMVYAAGQSVIYVRTDRQTRTAAAATGTGAVYVYDGATWATLALPAGSVPSATLEVIVRTT